jgi:putative transposase
MTAATTLAPAVGVHSACEALTLCRATWYRRRKGPRIQAIAKRRSPLALAPAERAAILAELHSERFVDKSPRAVHACLLDEGRYLGSVRTMYRLLAIQGEVKERRQHRRHSHHAKPELLATGPNQVWSWDITKLKGPRKWTYFYLYVIIDIYSRMVVGWMLAYRESAELAGRLIAATCEKQGIERDQLTIHADRGASMTSRTVALLMADLGITRTHSRPYVSNDNPFSESAFKTLKYHPSMPERFGSYEDAISQFRPLFTWYNTEHRHSGLAMLTPETVHYGRGQEILEQRRITMAAAFKRHPARFKGQPPRLPVLPEAVWINKPTTDSETPVSPIPVAH